MDNILSMNKKDLAKVLAKKCNLSMGKSTEVINTFVGIIIAGLYCGETISINGLGNFSAIYKKASIIRLPNSTEMVVVPARFIPKFRCSKVLKSKFRADFG